MTKTEISKQLAEQENKEHLASQAEGIERNRQSDSARIADLTEQMARLAETMAAMTRETKGHLSETKNEVVRLTREAESGISRTTQTAHRLEEAADRLTWKLWTAMILGAVLAAPAAVSAYSLWQHHYAQEQAQAAEWRDFRSQVARLTSAEHERLLKILHWNQKR